MKRFFIKIWRSLIAICLTLLFTTSTFAATSSSCMYIVNHGNNTITQATLAGSSVATFNCGGLLNGPSSIALDIVNGKIYVTNDGTGIVVRANLDGTSATTIISTGLNMPGGIALDLVNNKIYIANSGSNTISRANLDGTGLTSLGTLNGTLNGPANMTLNVAANKMYVTNYNSNGPNGTVSMANLDGTGGVALTLSGLLGGTTDVNLDLTNNKMYVINGGYDNHIIKANLDGTGAVDLGTLSGSLTGPAGIALDVPNGKMYIVDDNGNDKVYQTNLDGTGVVNLGNVGGTINNPYGIVLNLSVAPTVSTQAVSSITATTATGNGTITSLGVPNPTVSGICWNTSTSPTTSNFKTTDGSTGATGAFTGSLTSLSANTTYYVRAYATNTAGTSYGNEVTFTSSISTGLDVASATALSLYPNPATDGFTINTGEKITTVSIYNLSGSLVLSQQITGKSYINISSLQQGVYVVKADGIVGKLVKK